MDKQDTMASIVQYQAKVLAALQARDLDVFSQLLEDSQPDASCLEAACREPDCVEFVELLLARGVEPNTINLTLQHTPLHIASELGYYQVVQTLLSDARTDVNSVNGCEQTALHLVVKNCKEDPERFRRCIALLVDHHIDVNSLDWLGNTALHYAAENEDQETALLLLKCGAYLGARNYEGELCISGLEADTLETFLNSCITLVDESTLKIQYEFLVPDNQLDYLLPKDKIVSEDAAKMISSPIPEMDPVLAIAAAPELQHLISHPVLSTFINVKWQRCRKFYFFSLFFYSLFVGILTAVILEQFLPRKDGAFCPPSVIACFWKVGGRILLGICCVCEIVKFMFMLGMSPIKYARDNNSFDQFILMILAIFVVFTNVGRTAAAVTLLFGWIYLLRLTGQHHAVVLNFYLYKRICFAFLGIFAWSCLLIFAFSFSFFTLFQDTKTYIPEKHGSFKLFWNPLSSIFTTLAMFVGGFETKFLEFESLAVVSHLLYILFCFLVVVVLANMLTSVAVRLGAAVSKKSNWLHLVAMAKTVTNVERCCLGNPLYMYLRMKRLKLSYTRITECTMKSVTSLWMLCNWRRYLKGLEKMVVVYPRRSVVFPVGKGSSVVCKYVVPEEILRDAIRLAKGEIIYKSQEQRLSEMQTALKRMEQAQQEILALLKSQK